MGAQVSAKVEDRAERAIRARMRELGLTQPRLAKMVGKSPSWTAVQLLPNVEGTVRHFWAKEPESFRRLLRALQWTPEEFTKATGIELPGLQAGHTTEDLQPGTEISGGLVMVPVVGVANGGKPVDYGIPVEKSLVRPNTVAFKVEGDSMDDGTEEAIKDGDWVLVDTSLTDLVNGKVYLIEVIGDGLCVKRARRLGGKWWLISDNPEGESFKTEQVHVIGQVYGKVSFGWVR